jgi:peptide/nickel transport system substrate-binding protein
VISYCPTIDAVRLGKDPKYHVEPTSDIGLDYAIWMNVAVPPLDKKEVRQALNYAIDRKRFVDRALFGLVGETRTLSWTSYSTAF